MPRRVLAALLLCLAGCSPTFNWREVRAEAMGLRAMFPCKPDKGSRTVPMAGRQVELHVLGCDAGGATFAVLSGDIGDPLRAGEVLAQWQRATVANLHGAARDRPFALAGALPLAQSLRVTARGSRAGGAMVDGEAAYFARGSRVFQAVVYAERMPGAAAEMFFAGLRLE